jgi:hypothetical protein
MGQGAGKDRRLGASYKRLILAAVVAGLVLAVPAQRAVAMWTPPGALNTNAGTDSGSDYGPEVTTDGAGNWVAVWYLGGTFGPDADILVSRSTDNGATWTTVQPLNTNAGSDSGDDASPQVTTDGAGNWVAVWHSDDTLGGTIGTDYDILVSRSTDNGATWTAPAALNTNAGTDSLWDYRPQVTTGGAGNWVAVWESNENLGGTIGTDYDILVSRSTDNGATWTTPAALNSNAATDSGLDAVVQVTTDGAGNWVAVWYSDDNLGGTIGTDSDILVSRSTDNGATWTAVAALNTNAGTDSGGDWPHQVTTDGAGNWVAVWYSDDSLGGTIGTDYDVLVSRSTDNGATWTAVTALNSNAGTDSGFDGSPQVTTDGAGNWVAVWYSNENVGGTIGWDTDILVSRSTDNGATWTAPAPLNTNAASDSGSDYSPRVTADGAGNWVAVWDSTENIGGTIGTDDDILVSRSEFNWNEDADGDGTPNIDDDDIDGDGIDNGDEADGDADGDTIPNYLEPDADGDGMSDGFEADNGFDPVDDDEMGDDGATGPDGTPDGENDWDGDGYSNEVEEAGDTDPTDAESVPVPVAGVFALLVLAFALCVIGLKRRRKESA